MPNVLMINPASEQFGGMLSRYVPVGVPVATGILTAYLQKHGTLVKVHDEEMGELNAEILKGLCKDFQKPLMIGISVLTVQAHRAYHLIKMIKNIYPRSIVILGGIHVTALPDEGIQAGADFVVRGEGEIPFLSLARALSHQQDWTNIRGISYRKEDGTIHHNPDGELIRDLDTVPMFPYELFQDPRYDMGFITGARGCPYTCSYCSQRLLTGLTYRFHSPKRIVEQLDLLINKYRQKHILFYDDNFSVKKSRVKDLCDTIVGEGLHKKATFAVQTRADNLYDEIMPYLKKANFTSVSLGMETGVERLATLIVKGETVQRHIEAAALSKKYGITVSMFMIFGLPTETREDRKNSYKLIKNLKLGFTKFNNLIPYPGTLLYKQLKDSREIKIMPYWENFNSTLTATRSIFDPTPLPYVPEGTTEWQLKRDIVKTNFSFYFAPRGIWNVLTRKGGPGFVMLPEYWYLKPRELYEMIHLGIKLLINLTAAIIPERMGEWIFYLKNKNSKTRLWNKPEAIDGTMRQLIIQKPQFARSISA